MTQKTSGSGNNGGKALGQSIEQAGSQELKECWATIEMLDPELAHKAARIPAMTEQEAEEAMMGAEDTHAFHRQMVLWRWLEDSRDVIGTLVACIVGGLFGPMGRPLRSKLVALFAQAVQDRSGELMQMAHNLGIAASSRSRAEIEEALGMSVDEGYRTVGERPIVIVEIDVEDGTATVMAGEALTRQEIEMFLLRCIEGVRLGEPAWREHARRLGNLDTGMWAQATS